MSLEAFEASLQLKVEITPHNRWLEFVKYCDLLDWIRAKWLEIDKNWLCKISPQSAQGVGIRHQNV